MDKMMRIECYIPKEPNVPAQCLIAALLDRFGGYTIWDAHGAWCGGNGVCSEEVQVVQVLAPDTGRNRLKVDSLVRKYKRYAEQESALYVINEHEVHYV